MIVVVISLYLLNGGSHASSSNTLHVLMGVSVYNVTHMYLPNKTSSSLAHSVNRMRE